jgi:hypothetical protein
MPPPLPEQLFRQLAAGDAVGLLVARALFASDGEAHMACAARTATTTRDRQLVAIANAHLRGDRDLVDALSREHLVDHPDNVLVAWIAGASRVHPPLPRS